MGTRAQSSNGGTSIADAKTLQPASGNQLWRLQDLGELPEALKRSGGEYVTKGIAGEILDKAKQDGRW